MVGVVLRGDMREKETHDVDGLLGRIESVRALARRLVRDASAADDAVQDVLVAALRRPGGSDLASTGWLRRALRHRVVDDWRVSSKRRDRERIAARQEAFVPGDPAELAESHRRLATAALELEEPYRTAILLRYFHDQTPREIAERTDRSVAAVKKQIQRGLDQLRARLRTEYGDDRRWVLAVAPIAVGSGSSGITSLESSLAGVAPWVGAAAVVGLAALAIGQVVTPETPVTSVEPLSAEALSPHSAETEALASVETQPTGRTASAVRSEARGPSVERIEFRARFVDERGAPIEGAVARWLDDDTIDGGKSDADGALVFARERGSWSEAATLRVDDGRHAAAFLTWRRAPDGPVLQLGDQILYDTAQIEVRLVDDEGPIETKGWSVYASQRARQCWRKSSFHGAEPWDEDGTARLVRPPHGQVELVAYHISRARTIPMSVDLARGNNPRVDLRYSGPDPARRVGLRFTWQGEGLRPPVAPESLWLERNGRRVAGSKGVGLDRMRFEGVADEPHTLVLTQADLVPQRIDGVRTGTTVEVALERRSK